MAAMVIRVTFQVFLGIVAFIWITYFIIYRQNFELTFGIPFVTDNNKNHETISPEKLFNRWKGRPYSGVDNYIKYATVKQNKSILQPYRFRKVPIVNNVLFQYPITVPACTNEHNVFMVIVSAPSYFEKRQIIRDTWIQHIDFPANIAFVIGMTPDTAIQKEIEQESSNHGDIIQVDMVDGYWNLTLKDVAVLNWLNINCPRIPFVFKCDDDVYVNVHNLGAILKALPQNEASIYGTKNLNHLFVQREYGKWKVSYEEWPWTSYPPYVFGASILISGKAVSPLLEAAQETPYFEMEDIYLTGLVARKAGVRLRPTERMFVQVKDVNMFSNPCFVIRTVSWLTYDSIGMKDSHLAAQQLYIDNTTSCNDEAWSNKTVVLDFSSSIMDEILVELNEN